MNLVGDNMKLMTLVSVNIVYFGLLLGSLYPSFPSNRARCNSLLHLFGAWLFEAALIDCESQLNVKAPAVESNTSSSHLADRSRASSVSVTSESSLHSSRPRSATVIELPDTCNNSAPVDGYENGRAEALGALCRIFSSKCTDEDILPQYLARFYVVLNNGLKIKDVRQLFLSMLKYFD